MNVEPLKIYPVLQICFFQHQEDRGRRFLSEHASQLLVQALVLSRLDYCSALLTSSSQFYQTLTINPERGSKIIFEPKRMHVTPLFISLHWLPIALLPFT